MEIDSYNSCQTLISLSYLTLIPANVIRGTRSRWRLVRLVRAACASLVIR